MGDTPEKEKGVSPWKMSGKLRRGVKGKKDGMGSGMGLRLSFVV
jgi:hypothetical protein